MRPIGLYWVAVLKRWSTSKTLLIFLLTLLFMDFFFILRYAPMSTWGELIGPFLLGSLPTAFFFSLIPPLFSHKYLRAGVSFVIALFFSLLFIWEYHLLTECNTLITNSVLLQYHTHNEAERLPELLFSGIFISSWLWGGVMVIGIALFAYSFSLKKRYPSLAIWRVFAYAVVAILFFYSLQRENYQQYTSLRDLPSLDKLSMVERFVTSTQKAMRSVESIDDLYKKLMSHDIELQDSIPSRPPHNVVCILGESLRKLDMHCYGYPLENTPRIDSLIETGDLLLYTDVVASYPNTDYSVRNTFTYMTGNDADEDWVKYPSLMQAFRKAGYYTYWVSNQEKGGMYIRNIYALSKTSDSVHYASGNNIRENGWIFGASFSGEYDEVLLDLLKSYQTDNQNLLEIVHLMGNHNVFVNRYPKSWSRFTEKDIPEENLTLNQKKLTAEYMNSILYNDYVVSEIIKRYSHSSSLVFYFSDHGLSRYDDPDHNAQFNHNWHITALRIPFMVYMSPQFIEENPDIAAAIKSARHKPFKTDLFSHSLSALMGIITQYSHPAWEFWSPQYDEQLPRRIYTSPSNIIEIPAEPYTQR